MDGVKIAYFRGFWVHLTMEFVSKPLGNVLMSLTEISCISTWNPNYGPLE